MFLGGDAKMLLKRGYKMKTEVLELRFGGSNDIDLETLSESLSCIVTVLSKIADKSLQENDFCKFKVKAIEKGSFVITIEQIVEIAAVLFPYMPPILESLSSIMELRKTLGGQNPEKIERNGDTYKIIAKGGSLVNIDAGTYNIYVNDPIVEKSLANVSKIISDDNDRSDFSIETKSERGEKRLSMNHDDLLRTSKALDVESFNEDVEEQYISADLIVKKPDLIGDSKWQFVFVDRIIYAEVKDEIFLEKVRNKEISFPLISKLRVNMIVKISNGKALNYTIVKVEKYE